MYKFTLYVYENHKDRKHKKRSSVSGIQIFNFYAKTLKNEKEISVFSLKVGVCMICNFIHA